MSPESVPIQSINMDREADYIVAPMPTAPRPVMSIGLVLHTLRDAYRPQVEGVSRKIQIYCLPLGLSSQEVFSSQPHMRSLPLILKISISAHSPSWYMLAYATPELRHQSRLQFCFPLRDSTSCFINKLNWLIASMLTLYLMRRLNAQLRGKEAGQVMIRPCPRGDDIDVVDAFLVDGTDVASLKALKVACSMSCIGSMASSTLWDLFLTSPTPTITGIFWPAAMFQE